MKSITRTVLGLAFAIANVPESVAEFDGNAKREGACLDEATNNILYRSTFPDIRSAFLDALERETQLKRTTKAGPAKKDGTPGAEVYDESESKYFARVCALYQPEGAAEPGVEPKHFQYLADKLSNGTLPVLKEDGTQLLDDAGQPVFYKIAFDASATERSGEKKIAKVYLDAAGSIIKMGAEAVAKATAKLKSLNPEVSIDFNEDGTVVVESLALAVKANEDRKRAESVADLVS
jgi:hypothetical protein